MAVVPLLAYIKRAVVGAPIPSHRAHHERFSRTTGLAVLSSDPLSSVAYATEEILRVLAAGGVAALALVTPIGAVIALMLAVVVFSYRQTIEAYPNGGGAYIVAKENLGRMPSLIAAADAAATASLREQWPRWGDGIELAVLPSPERSLLAPLLDYIEQTRDSSHGWVTVVLPEFVPRHLWQHIFHNQHALLLKGALLFKPHIVVTSVPFHLGAGVAEVAAPEAAEQHA